LRKKEYILDNFIVCSPQQINKRTKTKKNRRRGM